MLGYLAAIAKSTLLKAAARNPDGVIRLARYLRLNTTGMSARNVARLIREDHSTRLCRRTTVLLMFEIFNVRKYANYSQLKRAKLLRRAFRSTGGWRCHLCGGGLTADTATIDHIDPLSLGGATSAGTNLKLAHKTCNNSRGSAPVHLFKMAKYLVASNPCIKARSNERIPRKRRQTGQVDASSQR